ncbi:hypothetical protein [Nostoc sp.]|uniref:hypothetical protein n=1 Tax=Nostoc sp. TaxID=1180 RepID=UPI002FF48819
MVVKFAFHVQLRKLYKIVGWVERSKTQQSQGSVGFRSSNATCLQVGKPAQRSGSPTYV